MMNRLTSMKIAWDNMVSAHISTLYGQRLLGGVLNHFAERGMGYEYFFYIQDGGMKFSLIDHFNEQPRFGSYSKFVQMKF